MMTDDQMNAHLNAWATGTSVPLSFNGSIGDIREGAWSFAAFLMDKVEPVKAEPEEAEEPPKEASDDKSGSV